MGRIVANCAVTNLQTVADSDSLTKYIGSYLASYFRSYTTSFRAGLF